MDERRTLTIANKAIKGLTIEIGGDTTNLGKALDDVTKQSQNLSGELSQVNRMLKLDPGNADLLAQKQQILTNAIEDTSKKLEILKTAEAQVQEQFERGEVSEAQVRELQREVIRTTQELGKLEKAAEETEDAIKGLGDKSEDAAEEIKDTADNSEDAERALAEMGDSAANVAKTGLAALAAAATAAVASIVAIAEESREYRTAMGKLDTAFKDNGHNAEVAYKAYAELQGVLGETDQATEAASFLAELCDTEEDLADWTEILTGVYGKFGAALPIEGLAEAANESAKTGEVVGALADAINWAAEEGETFGVVLKDATEENEDWNKAVEAATKAEDYFALALEDCNSEQERQQLITKTLTKYYKSAATQYKETNKEVIRANETTEKWNRSMSRIGDYVEPVITDIKEMGVALLQKMEQPLKNTADFISTKFIPAIKNISSWVNENKEKLIAVVTGLAAAMVTFKAASLATKLAEEGLTVATIARTAAQTALNAVMAASPAGLVATAVAGLTTALVVYAAAINDEALPKVQVLTEEEKKLIEKADLAAESFREQQKSTSDAVGKIQSEMGHVTALKDELLKLADSSGKVKEKDQERVKFILDELNDALGTEYEMTGGVIKKYDELKASIDDVIQSKLANALLEANNAAYVTAVQEKIAAQEALTLKEKDYEAQQRAYDEYYSGYLKKKEELEQKLSDAQEQRYGYGARMAQDALVALEGEKNRAEALLKEKEDAYNESLANLDNYYTTIENYEEAQTAALSGNYDRTVEILSEKRQTYSNYGDTVDEETARALDTLKWEAVEAGREAKRLKTNFEAGVKGYTKEMVDEAEQSYKDTMDAYSTAYADANLVGGDLAHGLQRGMENERSNLVSKAKSLVSSIIGAMREAAESNSPAKKTIEFGEDLGEGAEIGIENKTKDVATVARRQTVAALKAYAEPATETSSVFSNIAETQARRREQSYQAAATANNGILGEILSAIKAGQVIALDGKALVGGTADNMDSNLGQRRVLVTRGAK